MTACTGVLPEKSIVAQLVKKFPDFYGTRYTYFFAVFAKIPPLIFILKR
jgi:hypothetical protein